MLPTLLSAVERMSSLTPDRPVLDIGVAGVFTSVTANALRDTMIGWALRFRAMDLPPGSVVFIVLEHRVELYRVYLGAMRAGLIPSFLPFPTSKQDPALYWASHEAVFARVQPACIVTYGKNIDPIQAILGDKACAVVDIDSLFAIPAEAASPSLLRPLDEIETESTIALLQHSSGTTGLKKGVSLTYGEIARQVDAYAMAIAASDQDCVVSWLPLYHDMGLISSFLMPLTLGMRIVSIGAFDWLARPDQMLRLIAQYRATLAWLPNFALNHLVRTRDKRQTYDLSSMRVLIGCSEPCRADTFARFDTIFLPHGLKPNALQVCYAMAETVFAVSQTRVGETPRVLHVSRSAMTGEHRIVPIEEGDGQGASLVSCGVPIAGIEVRIGKEAGRDTGEIQLRGDFVFKGYHRNPQATKAAFIDGWYRTGDIGFMHDGELFVCGRLKELLIVHGRNYYATDIEGIVSEVDGIKPGRVVAFGIEDKTTASEEAIVLAEAACEDLAIHPALEKRIKQAVFERLELAIKRVVVVAPGHVVKTTSGKVSRKDNIARYLEMQGQD